MALAFTTPASAGAPAGPLNIGSMRVVFGVVAGDNAYPTGGYTVTAATFGLSQIFRVEPSGSSIGNAAAFRYNVATGKLQVFSGGSELGNNGDATANTIGTFPTTVWGV